VTIEPHAVSRQGIDQGGRLGPELLGLEADAAIAVVTAVPAGQRENRGPDRVVTGHLSTVPARTR
jgi:hypothetical protein